MARGKKKFALIWWTVSRKTDVVPLSYIPNKKHHHVDALTNLTWQNYQTKEKTKESAKIIAISECEGELHKMMVTNDGELHDSASQIFTEEILKKQNEMKQQQKLAESIRRSNKKREEVAIGRDTPIFCGNGPEVCQSLSHVSTRMAPALGSCRQHTDQYPAHSSQFTKQYSWHSSQSSEKYPSHSPQSTEKYPSHSSQSIEKYPSHSPQSTEKYPSHSSQSTEKHPSHSLQLTDQYPLDSSHFKHSTAKAQLDPIVPVTSYSTSPHSINQAQPHFETHLKPQRFAPYSLHSKVSSETRANATVEKTLFSPSVASANLSHSHQHAPHSSHPKFAQSITPTTRNPVLLNSPDQHQLSPHRITDSDSSTDSSASTKKSNQTALLSYKLNLGNVSKRDIEFQESLLKAMKDTYAKQAKSNISCKENLPVQDYYLQPGNERAEISPNCGFYLPKNKINQIELKSTMNSDWKILVRETLLEVYGNNIANYSATGKRGNRPAIDSQLFKGIQDWVARTATPTPSKKEMIEFINKTASNKRKFQGKSREMKQISTQQHNTERVIVRKDVLPLVRYDHDNNLPPAIFPQESEQHKNLESDHGHLPPVSSMDSGLTTGMVNSSQMHKTKSVLSVNAPTEHRDWLRLPETGNILTTSAEVLNDLDPAYCEYMQI